MWDFISVNFHFICQSFFVFWQHRGWTCEICSQGKVLGVCNILSVLWNTVKKNVFELGSNLFYFSSSVNFYTVACCSIA